MSRTLRNRRPKLKSKWVSEYQYANGKVRDGTPTHPASGCENHGGCSYCEKNRRFSELKQKQTKFYEE